MTPRRNSSVSPGVSWQGDDGGYTLIEVVIALFLFIAIAIPMMAGFFSNNGTVRSQEALTATWLLEQEAAAACLFPDDVQADKHRTINGQDWEVVIASDGSSLVKYTLTASKLGKKRGELVVYGLKNQ